MYRPGKLASFLTFLRYDVRAYVRGNTWSTILAPRSNKHHHHAHAIVFPRSISSTLQLAHHQHEAEDEDDDEDEDVLLISDWDENVEGVDMLDDCDVLDVSSLTRNVTDTDQHTNANRDPERQTHSHTAVGGQPTNDPGGRGDGIETEVEDVDEDVDALLVGDYDPDMEEEAGLADMVTSPVTDPRPRRDSGSPEVRGSYILVHPKLTMGMGWTFVGLSPMILVLICLSCSAGQEGIQYIPRRRALETKDGHEQKKYS